MEKIEFIDYERIQEAYKNFVHALVWESRDLFEGLHEDAVNKYIERFAEANTDKAIEDTYNALCEVSTTRYDVYKHECNEQYDFVEEYVFHTDNLTEAMKSAMSFYRKAKRPHIAIFDNNTMGNVVEMF